VIEAAVADALALPAFGQLHVSGMAGRVGSRFRRAASIAMGPLTVAAPLFMEMAVDGLVRDAPGPVVGIVGYDVFRRAVLEVALRFFKSSSSPKVLSGVALSPGAVAGAGHGHERPRRGNRWGLPMRRCRRRRRGSHPRPRPSTRCASTIRAATSPPQRPSATGTPPSWWPTCLT
jgi:hypothetical protein